MNQSRLDPFLASLLIAAACDPGPQLPSVLVLDSAGVEIVTQSLDLPVVWTIDSTAATSIGMVDGDLEYLFDGIAGAEMLSDGRVAIANAGSGEVRFYVGATGAFDGSVGSLGTGPGEFKIIDWLRVGVADSIYVYDRSLRRVTVFDPNGRFFRTYVLEGSWKWHPPFLGPFLDGSLLEVRQGLAPLFMRDMRAGVRRDTVPYLRYDGRGATIDTILAIPGPELIFAPRRGTGGMEWTNMERPFGAATYAAANPTTLVLADNSQFEVRYYSYDGELIRISRIRAPRRAVTASDRRHFRDAVVSRGNARVGGLDELLGEDAFGEHWPYFGGLMIDELGFVWLQEYALPGDGPTEWFIISPDGRLVGRCISSVPLDILWIGASEVGVKKRDHEDVESVEILHLSR